MSDDSETPMIIVDFNDLGQLPAPILTVLRAQAYEAIRLSEVAEEVGMATSIYNKCSEALGLPMWNPSIN